MCREVRLGGYEQVGNEHGQRDKRMHALRYREARKKQTGPGEIDDVIDVIAIARTFKTAHPSDRAVEAVAEPIYEKGSDDDVRGR